MPERRRDKDNMKEIKILHCADLHLDSPFEGLSSGKASLRRREQRELLKRLSELARTEEVDLLLLSGDLLDSDNTYYETGEELNQCLRSLTVPVFIAPGNHDYYSPKSPYARLKLPQNVYVFTKNEVEGVELGELGVCVYGAAFTEKRSGPLLRGVSAQRREDMLNIMCIHGDVGGKSDDYNPISQEEIAASGMDYIGLGHIHKASGLKKAGDTWYSWPGCPEGRGFDETGEKTVNLIRLSKEGCELETRCIAGRRYESVKLDITGVDPLLAIHTSLPDDTMQDIYRITLTGEAEGNLDINRLYSNLDEMFFELQIRDETRIYRGLWDYAGEDSLRGLFLKKLKDAFDTVKDDKQRSTIEQAARWGLAALDNMEEVVRHDNK